MIEYATSSGDSAPAVGAARAATVYGAIGLTGDPFPRDPHAGAWVPLAAQATMLAALRDWLGSGGLAATGVAVVAGESGAGKTRLLERLVLAIADDDRLIGVVPDDGPRRTDAHLLRSAIEAVGATPAGRTGLELTAGLREVFQAHRHDSLPPVLLIDNAALSGSQLEILRGVLTIPGPVPEPTGVQVVLFGPPALPDRIARRRSLADLTRYGATIPPLNLEAARTLLDGRIAAVHDPGAAPTARTDPFLTDSALGILLDAADRRPGPLLALAHAAVREVIATGRRQVDAATARTVTNTAAAPAMPGRELPLDDAVIQTRLVLPGVDEGMTPGPVPRRRGQQR